MVSLTAPPSMTNRPRLRRACLAVPGSSSRMLEKARTITVDQVVIDLEDAVATDAKAEARRATIEALAAPDWVAATRSVRVNAVDTPWTFRDLEATVTSGAPPHTVVLPKAQEPGDVTFADRLLTQLEQECGLPPGSVGLELQIETATGLAELATLVMSSPRLEAILLGPGDLAAALMLPETTIGDVQPGYPGDSWHHVRATLAIQARRAGLQVVDGPYVKLNDEEGLRRTASLARAHGFDGKWVIHPEQIDPVNETFGTTQADVDRAGRIVDAYEAAIATGTGAIALDGEMIDEATIRLARLSLARGLAQGLVPDARGPSAPE